MKCLSSISISKNLKALDPTKTGADHNESANGPSDSNNHLSHVIDCDRANSPNPDTTASTELFGEFSFKNIETLGLEVILESKRMSHATATSSPGNSSPRMMLSPKSRLSINFINKSHSSKLLLNASHSQTIINEVDASRPSLSINFESTANISKSKFHDRTLSGTIFFNKNVTSSSNQYPNSEKSK